MPVLCQPNDPCLNQVSHEVSFSEDILDLAQKLRLLAHNPPWGTCVGLAAPQIGINKRIFVALDKIYINAKILYRSKEMGQHREGCYSIQPNTYHPTQRHKVIRIRYMTEFGQYRTDTLHDFEAQVVQHEYDHLEGIVIGNE